MDWIALNYLMYPGNLTVVAIEKISEDTFIKIIENEI